MVIDQNDEKDLKFPRDLHYLLVIFLLVFYWAIVRSYPVSIMKPKDWEIVDEDAMDEVSD